jgi:diacylglycerol kinase (ATP)
MSQGPHIAVLRNPRAGQGRHRAELDAAVATLRRTDLEVQLLDAQSAGAAAKACREAVEAGAAALVVAGGDGTVHLAIQALAGTGVPLGVLPAGTGNDFAGAVDVPTDIARAADELAAAVLAGRARTVDLARVTGPDGYHEWFAAVFAAGFDAIVNERANRMRWPRGPRRYDVAILAELARLKARRYRITMDAGDADARTLEVDGILVAVGNTSSYGGGMRICPGADPTDGLLDIVIGARMSRTTLVRLQPKLYPGTHVRHPLVSSYRARTVEIDADGITGYADGERACALPVTITADPGALRILG